MDKTILVILDGFGLNYNKSQNPIFSAKTPVIDSLIANHPFTTLSASGEEVGLSWGEVGNSEVGHFNLGSGQIIWQNLPKIDQSIRDGSFAKNDVLNELLDGVHQRDSALHLIGLVSNGGIHSHINHLFALMKLAKEHKLKRVYIHMISDGRDTPPKSGIKFLEKLKNEINRIGIGQLSTITGREFGMDRNDDWQKTKLFYNTLSGSPDIERFNSAEDILQSRYQAGQNDENLSPAVVDLGSPDQFLKDGDGVIIFNFRADRARQMTRAIADPNLNELERESFFNLDLVTMTPYEEDWNIEIKTVFDPPKTDQTVSSLISDNGFGQFHLAESEKKAHVTYFFNGGKDQKYDQESDFIIASPQVDSYDQKPEMSLEILTQAAIDAIKQQPDFIIINFANPDMVGHTGNFEAVRDALMAVDLNLGKLLKIAGKTGYLTFVTADHGNCEQMINFSTGEADKEHTVNPVPFFWVDDYKKTTNKFNKEQLWQTISELSPSGVLVDVSKTVLSNLEIKESANMVGEDLREALVKL